MFTSNKTHQNLQRAYETVKKTLADKNAQNQEYASANKKWKTEYDKLCVESKKREKTIEYLRKQVDHVQKTVCTLAVTVGHDALPKKVMTNLAAVKDYIVDLRAGKNELSRCVSSVLEENRALKKVSEERDALRSKVKELKGKLEAKTNEDEFVVGEYNELKLELEKALEEATELRLQLLEKNKTIQELARTAEEQSQKHTALLLTHKRKRSPSEEEDSPNKRAAM